MAFCGGSATSVGRERGREVEREREGGGERGRERESEGREIAGGREREGR